MRLSEFRVQKYKTILDTGWVKTRREVTCLLGKNESGKSAVLQAIWKSNNVAGVTFDMLYDYPRDRYSKERGTDPIVTSLKFALEAEDAQSFEQVFGPRAPAQVEFSSTYAGKRTFVFDAPAPKIELGIGHGAIEKRLQELAGDTNHGEQAKAAAAQLAALVGAVGPEAVRKAAKLLAPSLTALLDPLGSEHRDFAAAVQELITMKTADEHHAAVEKWIESRLPAFIYFEEYSALDTKIHLPTFLRERTVKPPSGKVRTQMALFEWTHLDAQEIQQLGAPGKDGEDEAARRRKEERSALLESASYDLTGNWTDWWDQRRHKLHISADGDDLVLRVSDNENPWQIRFHERSKGFQWFFSFYLTFLVESEKSHAGAILLLDEPGLHLHIRAQQKLLGFFQRVAEKNQLLFSSHSPFMIDPAHTENVRTVYLEKPKGSDRLYTSVSPGGSPKGDGDTMLPFQVALGYEVVQTLFLGKRVLIVEGITDYWIIQTLAATLVERGKNILPDDLVILYAGGTSHMMPLVSMFARPDATEPALVVLLDADRSGLEKATQLRRDLLPRGNAVAVISDADLLGVKESQVEDVVHRDEILAALTYVKGASFRTLAPPPVLNVQFLQQVYRENGWGEFSGERKAELLLGLVDLWRAKTPAPSETTLANAEKLLSGLAGRFGKTI
jgi:hypothetical protein